MNSYRLRLVKKNKWHDMLPADNFPMAFAYLGQAPWLSCVAVKQLRPMELESGSLHMKFHQHAERSKLRTCHKNESRRRPELIALADRHRYMA